MTESSTEETQPALPPVQVSPDALRSVSNLMRRWSGWNDSHVVFAEPDTEVSPFAMTDTDTHRFTVNADLLLRNPYRVLNTVTPFRLRQEAFLTGTLLHEAGHARHSKWNPATLEEAAEWKHEDGEAVTQAQYALARLMEEPRVEGLMARDAATLGAPGLDWTMLATAAHLLPLSEVSSDPAQAVMDVISSWAKRAGRHIAFGARTPRKPSPWVGKFNFMLENLIFEWLTSQGDADPMNSTLGVMADLYSMIGCDDDEGIEMLSLARSALNRLYPNTPPEDQPQPEGGACSNDPGNPGASPSTGQGESGTADQPGSAIDSALASAIAEALAKMEDAADSAGEADAQAMADAPPPPEQPSDEDAPGGLLGGRGPSTSIGGRWRHPTPEERDLRRGAERFLRDMVDPTETAKVVLTDQPSAMIDGAALSAWKASGGVREPRFFKRTRREIQPSAPVEIAILVDVSSSMSILQKPSAWLSWALSAAALDLRNFAGRGAQVRSTLVHWGDEAEVIQGVGQTLPGIREVPCAQGTSAMHKAMALVEEEMPGFFDPTERTTNRLLVQFTDWELSYGIHDDVTAYMSRGLEAGMNMLSVVPNTYTGRRGCLDELVARCPVQRGRSRVLKYDPHAPEQVWTQASQALGQHGSF